ncbi:MAG: LacI family DNA-binding transcriptional regulator [Abditibacteriaceae bacterium]
MNNINKNTKRRVTQNDIAKVVGVSHVAVSHVLHRSQQSRISTEKQEEIRRVAREMGYRPRRMTTHTVAVVVNTGTLYWGSINAQLTFIDRILRENGYRMTLVIYNENDSSDTIAEILNAKTVDGVLFWQLENGEARKQRNEIPWLFLGEEDHAPLDLDQVAMNTHQTMISVVHHLYQLGHRKMAIVTGLPDVGYHQRMEAGLAAALAELKVKERPVIIQNKEKELPNIIKKVFQAKSSPTAIIVSTANSAQIILSALLASGFEVPRDVSLISLMDNAHLALHAPDISATTANGEMQMRLSVERLLTRIANPKLAPQHTLLVAEIIPRQSLASARK